MAEYRKIRRWAGNVGDTMWEHSIPLALAGAGVGWFIVSNLAGSSGRGKKHPRHGDGGARPQGSGAEHTESTVEKFYSTVRDSAEEQAQRVYRQASRTFGDMVEEQPLLLGAAGLVIGAALGAVLPGTSYENTLVGETRDDLTRTVKEYGKEQLDKAQRVVERTVDAVKGEAEKQGFSARGAKEAVDQVRERAGNVASAVADTVREETGLGADGKTEPGRKEGQRDPSRGNEPTGRPG